MKSKLGSDSYCAQFHVTFLMDYNYLLHLHMSRHLNMGRHIAQWVEQAPHLQRLQSSL